MHATPAPAYAPPPLQTLKDRSKVLVFCPSVPLRTLTKVRREMRTGRRRRGVLERLPRLTSISRHGRALQSVPPVAAGLSIRVWTANLYLVQLQSRPHGTLVLVVVE